MPYSVTTQDGFTLEGIPDGLEPNSPEVLEKLDKLRARQQQRASQEAESTAPRITSSGNSDSNMLEDIAKGFGGGFTGMLESSALGMATLLEEEAELKAREKIQNIFDIDMLKGANEDSIAYKLSAGIGSIAALAPAALAGPAALPLAGAVAAGAGAGEASERARAYGATEEERSSAALKGSLIGLTEITPLGRLSKAFKLRGITKTLNKLGPKAVKGIASRVRNAAVTGLTEGAQEGAAAILQNLNEQGYNPERELVDAGVLEEALIGGGAGAILQALVDVLVKGKTKGTPKDTPLGEEAPVVGEETPDTAEGAPVVGEETPDTAEGAPVVEETPVVEPVAQVDPVDVDEVTGERLGATESEKAPVVEERLGATESEEDRVVKIIEDLKLKAEGTDVQVVPELIKRKAETGGEKFNKAITEISALISKKKGEDNVGGTDETGDGASVPIDIQPIIETGTDSADTEGTDGTGVGGPKQGATGVDGREDGQPVAVEQVDSSGTLTPAGVQAQKLVEQRAKEKRYDDAEPILAPKTLAKNELKDRGNAVGIDVDAYVENRRKNIIDPATGKKMTVKAAEVEVMRDIEAMEIEVAAQEAMNEELGGVVDRAIVPKPVGSETSARPADSNATVDDKFVASIGLTGKNKAYGDKLLATLGIDSGNTITNRDLANGLKNGLLAEGVTINKKTQAFIDQYAGKPNTERASPVKFEKLMGTDVRDEVLLRKAATAKAESILEGVVDINSPEAKELISVYVEKRGGVTTSGKTWKKLATKNNLTPQQIEELAKKLDSSDSSSLQKAQEKGLKKSTADREKGVAAKKKKDALIHRKREKYLSEGKSDEDAQAQAEADVSESTMDKYNLQVGDTVVLEGDRFNGSAYNGKLVISYIDLNNFDSAIMSAPEMEFTNGYVFDGNVLYSKQKAQVGKNFTEIRDARASAKKVKGKAALEARQAARGEGMGLNPVEVEEIDVDDAPTGLEPSSPSNYSPQFKAKQAEESRRLQEEYLAAGNTLTLTRGDISLLPSNYINVLDGIISVKAKNLLKNGDLRGALLLISGEAGDPRTKQIARVFAEAVGDTKSRFVDGDQSFVSTNGTVNIVGSGEIFVHTVLHEASHVAVDNMLDNPAHPMTKKLTALYNEAKPHLDSIYGARSLKEFASEGISNSKFQQQLARLNPDGSATTALERFFRAITNFIRSLMGAGTNSGALDTLDQSIMAILGTSPDTRGAGGTYKLGTRDGVKKILGELELVQKSFAPPTKKFREEFGMDGGTFLDSVTNMTTKLGALQLLDSQAVGDVAKAKGYGDMGIRLHKLIQLMRGKSNQADIGITVAVEKASKWAMENPAEQKLLDQIIYSREIGATIYQVDPTIATLSEAEAQYSKDPEKLSVWKEQQKVWKPLSAQAKKQYTDIRDVYKTQFLLMKKVITGRMVEVLGQKEADRLGTTVFDKMFDKNALAVYFPLVREGKYKLSYTPVRAKGENVVRDDRDNYVVEMFASKSARDSRYAVIRAEGVEKSSIRTTNGELNARDFRDNAPNNSFVRDVLGALDKGGIDESIQNEVMNLFIDSLPETSFAKSMKGRQGLEGYNHDSILSMRSKAFDIARQVQRIDIGGRIRALEEEIKTRQKELDTNNNANSGTTTAIGADMLIRAKFAVSGADNKSLEGVVKNANQLAFIYTIGFNASSAIVNLSQLGLVVGPMLGAEFGHIKTGKIMIEASAMVISSGNAIDSYYDMTQNTDEKSKDFGKFTYTLKKDVDPTIAEEFGPLTTLITIAAERSFLTQSYLADALGLDESVQSFEWLREKTGMKNSGRVSRANAAEKGMNSVSTISAIMFNAGERFNRQVTLLAAYKLSLGNIQDRESNKPEAQRLDEKAMQLEATEDALHKSMEYNGGAVLETGSRISSHSYGRIAFMYKNYGLRMYTTMLETGREAIDLQFFPPKNETAPQKEERLRRKKIVWGQVRGLHLSALLIAGIQGMPLYGAVAMLWDLWLGDDEDDADTVVRKYFTEFWYKGPLVDALGVDFSKRVRLNNLIFESNRYSRDPTIEESIGHHLGGPAFSTGKRLIRAYEDFSSGNIGGVERGIESLLPAGLTNILRNSPLGRFQKDGAMETRRGDVIYDDLTAGDFFAGMVGFPPVGYTFAQEQTNIEQGISGAVTKERSRLLKQYYVARRQGNYPESTRLFAEMRAFGEKHPHARITAKTLKRSYKAHQRTTAKMHNGTTISPMMKRVLEEQRDAYDTSGLFD